MSGKRKPNPAKDNSRRSSFIKEKQSRELYADDNRKSKSTAKSKANPNATSKTKANAKSRGKSGCARHAPSPQPEPPASRPPRLCLINLGCAKNTIDGETALGELLGAGWDLATEPVDADLVLVNTCGFIESAREESLSVIGDVLAEKDADGYPRVVAIGCFPEKDAALLERRCPELDAILGLGAYGRLSDALLGVLQGSGARVRHAHVGASRSIPEGPRLLTTPASYAYLRIADGCDNRCSYCTIPAIRGAFQSRPAESILDEARVLAEAGVRELILVAQDTTRYGTDIDGGMRLTGLLDALLAETDVPRIRLLYAHPARVDDALLDRLAGEARLCRYMDVPVQHVTDRMLRAMQRGYDRAQLLERLAAGRARVPGLVLRSTVITGFPGETEADFEAMLSWVASGAVEHLGAFAWSPEPDTPAFALPDHVPAALAEERRERILEAQQGVAFAWMESRVGADVDVLLDGMDEAGRWYGRTVAEAPDVDGVVYVEGKKFSPGMEIRACLISRSGYDMNAHVM